MKKVFIVILVFSITRIVISCCNNQEIRNINYSKISLTTGDRMISSNVQQSDSVSYEDMMVQIDFEYLEIAQIIKTSYSDLYAFDCDVFYELINKVKDLKVITLTDYNEQYLKDSEITVNYKVYSYYDRGFTDTTNYVIQYLNNIGYGRPNAIVYFKLKDKPITNKFHRFLVKVQLNDNSELNDTSEFVYITE